MANYVISIMVDAKDKNVKQVLGGVGRELQGLGDTAETTGTRMSQAFTGAGMAMAFGRAIPLIKNALTAYNELRAGMVGLQSIVKFTGEDWGQAQQAMKEYVSNGLVPMSQATTALKNLLLRGYGLERSIELLGRLKDAAAYGRQGQLSMGQAITSASEGLKNENSILVDNAGVTKNVSVMWKEYAASIGTTIGKLTQAQKLQAEYNGIMAETAPMLGNAAGLTGELAGKMAQAEAKIRELMEAVGESFAPAVADALSKITPFIGAITEFAKANPRATITLLGGSGLVAAVGALAAAFALMGPGGAIVIGVVAGLVALATVVASLVDKKRQAVQRSKQHALSLQAEAKRVKELSTKYEELKAKAKLTQKEQMKLRQVTEDLVELVPELSGLNKDQAQTYHDLAKAAREYVAVLDETVMAEYRKLDAQHIAAQLDADTTKGKIRGLEDQLESVIELANGETMRWRDAYGPEAQLAEAQLKRYNELYETQIDRVRELGAAMAALGIMPVLGPEWEEPDPDTGGLDDVIVKVKRLHASYSELREQTSWFMHGQEVQMWTETGEAIGDATTWMEAYFESKKQKEEETLARFQASMAGHLAATGKEMMQWRDGAISMVNEFADVFSSTMGALVTGNKDALEQLKHFWENFFSWLVGEIVRIIVKWFIGKVLTSMGIPGGGSIASAGMDIIGDASGSWAGGAQQGGVVRGGVRGLDSVLLRAQHGELVTDTALTRGLARMVGAFEGGRMGPGIQGPADDEFGTGQAGVIEEHYHFHSADYPSFKRALRGGQLGREIDLALRYGRLRR